jgi:hypothetical protein
MLVLGNSLEVDGYNFMRAAFGEDKDISLILFGNTNRCSELRDAPEGILSSNEERQALLDTMFSPALYDNINSSYPFSRMSEKMFARKYPGWLRELVPE